MGYQPSFFPVFYSITIIILNLLFSSLHFLSSLSWFRYQIFLLFLNKKQHNVVAMFNTIFNRTICAWSMYANIRTYRIDCIRMYMYCFCNIYLRKFIANITKILVSIHFTSIWKSTQKFLDMPLIIKRLFQ